MQDFSDIILYVSDVPRSVAFYAALLDQEPQEAPETFAMLPLTNGQMLGLWSKQNVQPQAEVTGGGSELAIKLDSDAEVDALHDAWSKKGLEFVQPPTRLGFGYTFVAADPDGHRIRAFGPASQQA